MNIPMSDSYNLNKQYDTFEIANKICSLTPQQALGTVIEGTKGFVRRSW